MGVNWDRGCTNWCFNFFVIYKLLLYVKTENLIKTIKKIEETIEHTSIILADFSAICDLDMDKKRMKGKKSKTNNIKLPKTFYKLANSLKLVNIWRMKNPFQKSYTSFSHPQKK